MAQITWNNVAAPNLGESNSLFAQAIQSLKDAGIGLKDTAKDYQTVVRNRSHAILQDYINSAKTPEELQSEAFNTGFKNLQATLANEYDAVKVNDYRDSAVDKLTKRAGDAVALDLNRLNLTSNTRKENTALGMAELQGLVDNPTAYAAKKAELTQKGFFDGKAEQDFQLGGQQLENALVQGRVLKATEGSAIEAAALDVKSKRQTMELAKLEAELAAAKAPLERAEIQARINKYNSEANEAGKPTKLDYANSVNGTLDALSKDLINARTTRKDNSMKQHRYTSIGAWELETGKTGKGKEEPKNKQWIGLTSSPMRKIVELARKDKQFLSLPEYVQATIVDSVTDRAKSAHNVTNSHTWFPSAKEEEDYKTFLKEAINTNTLQEQATMAEERSLIQNAVSKLMRVDGYSEEEANNIVNYQVGRIPSNEVVPDKTPTESERQAARLEATKNTPSALLLNGAKNRGGLGIALKPAADTAAGTPRSKYKLTAEDQTRLDALSEYATLKEQLSASNSSPTNTQAFQKAVIGLHLEQAKLGILDALNADKYVAEVRGKLKNEKLDPIRRKQLEQQLLMFQRNQNNFKGGD